MVIQRDLPVHVWGRATSGETVSVTFRDENTTVTTGRLGRWSVYLKPGPSGGPFEMSIKGIPAEVASGSVSPTVSPAVVIHDILVGDLWVASGQSNMEFVLQNAN